MRNVGGENKNNPQIDDTIPLWGTGVQDETAGCIFK